MFRYWTVPVEIVWENMVLDTKGKGYYRGIGLVEVLWKVCVVVVNCWMKSSVIIHNALYGFRAGIGTGTATLQSNLYQHLVGLSHELFFQVFLDLRNAYDLLYRDQCLKLLRGYGLGPNLDQILENYWMRQRIIPELGK